MLPHDVATGPAVIGTVMPDSPASEAGLKSGDIVREIDGESIKNTSDLSREIRLRQGQTIDFLVERDEQFEGPQQLHIAVKSRWDPKDTVYEVQSGDTSRSIARELDVPVQMIWAAAEIDVTLEEGQVLEFNTPDGPATYTVTDTDSVSGIADRFDVEQSVIREAAGLPDPDVVEPGTELRLPQGPTGITIANLYPFTESETLPVWEAIPKGVNSTWEALILARNQVYAMFQGGAGPDVAGPVGIAQATGQVVDESGWEPLLQLAALLSINLAIINMLPLPMLDGGRVAFVLLEVVRRGKRIAPEKEGIIHLIGFAVIITMAVIVTYLDIARIAGGGSLFDG